mmetsp:Transcript_26033/g.60819  ORF Transcript_26033/g.60819 Transcript_26033/m.60819 type:complete len:441 (+) Transcript_26033:50-1372(+)
MAKGNTKKRKQEEEVEEEKPKKDKKSKKNKRSDTEADGPSLPHAQYWESAMQAAAQQQAMVMQGFWPMQMSRPMMPHPFFPAQPQYGWFPMGAPQGVMPRAQQPRVGWPTAGSRSSGPARTSGVTSRSIPAEPLPTPAEDTADVPATQESASSNSSGTSSSSSSCSQVATADAATGAAVSTSQAMPLSKTLDAPEAPSVGAASSLPKSVEPGQITQAVQSSGAGGLAPQALAPPAASTPAAADVSAPTPAEDDTEADGIQSLLGGGRAMQPKSLRTQKKAISFKLQGAREAMAAAQKVTDLEAELKAVREKRKNVRDATTQTVQNPLQDGEKVLVWHLRPRGMESFPHFPKQQKRKKAKENWIPTAAASTVENADNFRQGKLSGSAMTGSAEAGAKEVSKLSKSASEADLKDANACPAADDSDDIPAAAVEDPYQAMLSD